MQFRPNAHDRMQIEAVVYTIAEHPRAPGIPYGQEGRAGVVFKLTGDTEDRAFKVFKPRYRVPAQVTISRRLAALGYMPGLRVCKRTVLTPQQHELLLRRYPDLTYSVVMPWIDGPTWMEVVLRKGELTREQSLALAGGLAEVLSGLEQEGVAHCDLSGPNVLLPALSARAVTKPTSVLELVDVEQMFGADLKRPELLPAGSPGYAHKSAQEGLWSSDADRLAGAVLIAEMLCWCDPQIRQAAWSESYFDPMEMQQPIERFKFLSNALHAYWGTEVAALFRRAWTSANLADCPTFGEWLVTLPKSVPAQEGFVNAPIEHPQIYRTLVQTPARAINQSSQPAAAKLNASSQIGKADVPMAETSTRSGEGAVLPPVAYEKSVHSYRRALSGMDAIAAHYGHVTTTVVFSGVVQ